MRKGSLKNLSAERRPTVGWQIFRGTLLYKYHWSSVDHNKLKTFSVLYLPVYKSIFYSLKICPKNRPRLIHGSKTEIKKSTRRISALGLFCTDLAALGPYCQDLRPIFSQYGPRTWLIRCIYILCVDISVIKPRLKMITVKWCDIISLRWNDITSLHGLNCPI